VSSKIKLPETPNVITRDTAVVVIFDDETELVWGEEKTSEDATRLAHELEIELRAVNYVRWHVRTFIQEMKEYLSTQNIDEGLLDSILIDGHDFARIDMNQAVVDSILMGADRSLRQKVMSKLGTHNFIV
jgi:hypothetical protein